MQTIKKQYIKSNKNKSHKSNKNKLHKNKINKVKKSRKNKHSITNTKSSQLTSLLDFKKNKSLTILSKPSDIKSATSVGDFYNLLEIHDNINKNCINKVQMKVVDGIKLNKKVSKSICECLFEKNKDLTIETLENKIKGKNHTPGSACISILDKFIQEEKLKLNK